MRKTLIGVALLVAALLVFPIFSTSAAPAAQFSGCADEVDEVNGARYQLTSLNGLTVSLIAIGVEDFDPTITVLDAEGNIVTCDDDSDDAAFGAVELPGVTAGPSETAAKVEFDVPGDQGRLDYEVIIGSSDGTSGEFVLLYWGPEVFGADNEDVINIVSNETQTAAEVPLGLYVSKRGSGEIAFDPSITFSFGESFSATCGKSSAESLCDGEHEDLTEYTITWGEERVQELNGNDVMLAFELGGDPGEYTLSVGSYEDNSFGPYIVAIHSGVAYPEATEE